jgi:hypothetical protein
MFKKKTVFILGAGASRHYGYPTGEELVRAVRGLAKEIPRQYSTPDESNRVARGYSQTYPRYFRDQGFGDFMVELSLVESKIAQANPLVIDDFLGRNIDIAEVGKLLIAMALFRCERKSKFRPTKKDLEGTEFEAGDWVRHIVHQLTVGCEKPEDLLANQVTFVTFNYDLSLEQRMYWALANYQWFDECGVTDKFFSKGRFLHIYGQLYDWDTKRPGAPAGTYNNPQFPLADEIDRAFDAAKSIRTISPGKREPDPTIDEACGEIAGAEYLYFLGYGFDRRNNELLGLGSLSDKVAQQRVFFTNYGNHNKVSKTVERIYAPIPGGRDTNGEPFGSLLGESYQKRSWSRNGSSRFTCEKSIKSVYDALAEDFDWPD